MSWKALVLAGSRKGGDPVAQATGVSHKAVARIAGKPMTLWPLEALAASGRFDEILVSIEPDAPELPPGPWTRIEAGESPSLSVLQGVDVCGPPVMVTTADHALLTPEMIHAFLDAADGTGADAVAGVATREVIERDGPGPKRTYLRFGKTRYSGCNLFALRSPKSRNAVLYWRRLEALRKKPLAMARAVGMVPLVAYALNLVTPRVAEQGLSKRLGASVAFVEMDDPDAAHDVDKPEDIAHAEARLNERPGARG